MDKQPRGNSDQWMIWAVITLASILLLFSRPCGAETDYDDDTAEYLKKLSLEQLLEIEVISVLKTREKYTDAAAAVFVIMAEDIRRSGVTTVADALRLAPGIEVARIDANKWAISSRGFNGVFANQLLVLVDGRNVYSSFFSGVPWDIQDLMLEDIKRIELIRGPGATLWGANAVNGIINIVTKSAQKTQGGLISVGAGTEEKGFGGIRYGTTFGEQIYIRFFTKYFDRDDGGQRGEQPTHDAWKSLLGGFRMDWDISNRHSLTIQGDLYDGEAELSSPLSILTPPYEQILQDASDTSGGHILAQWEQTLSGSSSTTLQLYYNRSKRILPFVEESRDVFDADFQHRFDWRTHLKIIWGAGYRLTSDNIRTDEQLNFKPQRRHMQLFSAFIQGQSMLIREQLWLTLGSKFEHNDFSGFEIQPTGRISWKPHDHHVFWGAISRAVRTPSRVEHDSNFNDLVIPPGTSENPSSLPVLIYSQGNSDLDSEEALAYELGYRFRPHEDLFIDIAAFYNDYEHLTSIERGIPFLATSPVPHVVTPFVLQNGLNGEGYGIEIAADWRPLDWWRLQSNYTYITLCFHGNTEDSLPKDAVPQHQVSLRSSLDLPGNIEFDVWFRYADSIPGIGIDSYTTLDVRLGWKPTEQLEFSLVGQNLLETQHLEFIPFDFPVLPTEVERSYYGKITWRF